MKAIQIEGITSEDLLLEIRKLIQGDQAAPRQLIEHGNMVVDRRFLSRNFKWTRHKIEKLENTGLLTPVFTGDGKSRDYRLSQCLEVRQEEISLLKKN